MTNRYVSKAAISLLFGLAGCTAHSPMIVKSTTDTEQHSAKKYAPHANKVFITESDLGPAVKYELLERIEIGKVWYGSGDDVKESLAERARQIGADAVIQVATWHQPSGFSWAAPHGSGKAVKILEGDLKNLPLPPGA